MAIKHIDCWETSDGRRWFDSEQARLAEIQLERIQTLSKQLISFSELTALQAATWIDNNFNLIRDILNK